MSVERLSAAARALMPILVVLLLLCRCCLGAPSALKKVRVRGGWRCGRRMCLCYVRLRVWALALDLRGARVCCGTMRAQGRTCARMYVRAGKLHEARWHDVIIQ